MKHGLMIFTAWATLCAVALTGLAQDARPAKKPAAAPKAASKVDAPTPAQLRIKMHRAMAALIEAQAAAEPDAAKIKKLTKQLQSLRKKILAQAPAAPYRRPPGWQCPYGGPGMGYGPGWGGPGRGYGRGGPGKGYGRGPGWGRGAGYGWGPGWAAGRGAGLGRGRAFVDEDRDGVCDNYQSLWGEK